MALTTFGVGGDPFAGLDRAIDRAFGRAMGGTRPGDLAMTVPALPATFHPMDILETDKAYLVKADAPGFSPDEVHVELNEGVITISGNKQMSKQETDKQGRVVRRERAWDSFSRSFTLPDNVEEEGINASLDSGVLTVTVPKTPVPEKPAPKRITVQAGTQ